MVFDQGFDPTGSITVFSGFGGANTNQYRAQTFQVGLTGTLSEVDVFVHRFSSSPTGGNLVLEIRRQTSSGVPSDASADSLLTMLIASTSIGTSAVFLPVDVSSADLTVSAGDKLAIVLHADSGTPTGLTYIWDGQNNNPYANGGAFEEVVGNHSWGNEGLPNADLGFETFVNSSAAPEPGSLALSALGSLSLLGYFWRKRGSTHEGKSRAQSSQ
jgi:PEP-CTERM motif